MGIVRTVAPTQEPVSVSDAIQHLRLDATSSEPTPPAPTVALAGAGAGNVDNGAHRYRITYVTADGETDGGDISAAVTVADKTTNGRVAVTNIPIGGRAVTSRKLYRTAAAGSIYLLLTTIADNTTTSYTDNTADTSLGAAAPSSNTTGDPMLVAKLAAARGIVEEYTRRALITQTWELTLEAFPCSGVIDLPRPPLIAVSSIQYVDENGDTQTLDTSLYTVDTSTGRIARTYGASWPSTNPQQPAAVTVTYTAGYGGTGASVPAPICAAILLALGDLWERRESTITGTIVTANPAVQALLSPFRVVRVG